LYSPTNRPSAAAFVIALLASSSFAAVPSAT
jgi:hypothetical protein